MDSLLEEILQSPYGLWLILGGIILLFIVFTLLIVNLIYLGIRSRLKSIQNNIGGKIVYNILDGPYIILKYRNVNHKITIKTGGQNSPSSLVISRPNPLSFRLYCLLKDSPQILEYKVIRSGKGIEFDRSFFKEDLIIKSNSVNQARVFLQNNSNIKTINFFIEKGYQKIAFEKKELKVQKWGYHQGDYRSERMEKILHALNYFNQ